MQDGNIDSIARVKQIGSQSFILYTKTSSISVHEVHDKSVGLKVTGDNVN